MQNMKPVSLSVLFFTLAREKIFSKMHSAESRCVIRPEKIPFAGASKCHSALEIVHAGALKGLTKGLFGSRYTAHLPLVTHQHIDALIFQFFLAVCWVTYTDNVLSTVPLQFLGKWNRKHQIKTKGCNSFIY